MVSIAQKMREIRESKALSIRSFARIVNLSYGYISKLEKSDGENRISPSIDVLKQICDRSHYDFALFLQETGYIKPFREKVFSNEEREIMDILGRLSFSEKETLFTMIRGLKRPHSLGSALV